MAKTQYYGIKYPFTYDNDELVYLDLNETYEDSIQSQILHIIFTPKGQRLRWPSFGSDIVKYVFDPKDSMSFENIKSQLRTDISTIIPNVTLDDIKIIETEEEHEKIVSVYYTVKKGNKEESNNVAVKL